MKHFLRYVYYHYKNKLYKLHSIEFYRDHVLKRGGITLENAAQIQKYIYDMILSGEPFMVGRYGATELFAMRVMEFDVTRNKQKALEQLSCWSGFFPTDVALMEKFYELMCWCSKQCDVIGPWDNGKESEEYFIKKYCKKNIRATYVCNLEPWILPEKPWTAALQGKKVLVIHPFAESIKAQYEQNREFLFEGTDILPQFELKTLKAVQTLAGEADERFRDWFEALQWMSDEAMRMDFDVALIGCGAYGFSLAAKIKQAGKQAIHLAGATQILFGIKGKRWEVEEYWYANRFFNDKRKRPAEQESIKNTLKVENSAYW